MSSCSVARPRPLGHIPSKCTASPDRLVRRDGAGDGALPASNADDLVAPPKPTRSGGPWTRNHETSCSILYNKQKQQGHVVRGPLRGPRRSRHYRTYGTRSPWYDTTPNYRTDHDTHAVPTHTRVHTRTILVPACPARRTRHVRALHPSHPRAAPVTSVTYAVRSGSGTTPPRQMRLHRRVAPTVSLI